MQTFFLTSHLLARFLMGCNERGGEMLSEFQEGKLFRLLFSSEAQPPALETYFKGLL